MKKRIDRILLIGCLVIALMFAVTGCKGEDKAKVPENAESSEVQETSKNQVFGSFEAETLDGEMVTEDIFARADLTMVNIWATFCGPCLQEMPDLGELSREYEGSGIAIVGVIGDVEEAGDETAAEIVEKTQADYTHLVASPGLRLGILNKISAYPTTIFVNAEGEMVGDAYAGARSKEEWKAIIEELKEEV